MSDSMPNVYQTSAEWSQSDYEKFTVWLKSILLQQTCSVTFLKVNGEERVMHCTLMPSMLPPVTVQESADNRPARKQNDAVMPVYDLEAAAWRSFTVRNVIRVSLLEPTK